MEDRKIAALKKAAEYLSEGNVPRAEKVISEDYRFEAVEGHGRHYTAAQAMEQFFRDGFIDRYSGKRLVNPGMLRVLSEKMPKQFPYHPHWKMGECHVAYWEYQPTVDHIDPVARGGEDSPENWVTTSMMNNAAKGVFTLEQLGWTLKPRGDINEWDGLSGYFVAIVKEEPSLLEVGKIKEWYKATKKMLDTI
ncbi:MAG: HNH endonuclease [Clostridiales bacterium]|nr:HNH endonuclease [Clostridiales bacterium]